MATADQQAQLLEKDNKIFINKLNDICANYERFFADVKACKTLVEEEVVPQQNHQRIVTAQCLQRVEFTEQKLTTIEKHLPTMI